jgi:quinol monooxygenase YgiN
MTFKIEEVQNFLDIFEASKDKIRQFKGCEYLELLQDRTDRRVFFTYSSWLDQNSLDAYRHSELFHEVWTQTKALFDAKPEAWSTDRKHELK